MTNERVPLTTPIDPETIERVYTGRPGCGCGCNGNYWPDQYATTNNPANVRRQIRRVVKAINERIGTGAGVQTGADGKPFCYYVEDATTGRGENRIVGRYMWAYVKGGK